MSEWRSAKRPTDAMHLYIAGCLWAKAFASAGRLAERHSDGYFQYPDKYMIEIVHKTSGEVLCRVNADTLRSATLYEWETNLVGADFRNQKLDDANFTLAMLDDADFSGASCMKANFYSCHLQRANLSKAKLLGINGEGTDFRHAILTGAEMYAAWLRHASFANADLQQADLKAAYLGCASLRDADLREANLSETVLHGTDLTRANMGSANLCSTVFADCTSLHKAQRLADMQHLGPSSLDHLTLRACAAHLPDVFLLGIGYTEAELFLLRKMYPAV